MTGTEVVPAAQPGTLAPPMQPGEIPEEFRDLGLEEFGPGDYVMPRINIVQKEALFQDNLTKEKFESLECIVLGLHKGRILWEPEIGQPGQRVSPLCKSVDHDHGYANPKTFPWDATGFDKEDYDAEQPVLECANCPLKDWGSHPNGKTPWCTEQYTLIILRVMEDDSLSPCTLSLQRSGLSSVKAFLSSFKNRRIPPMVQYTTLTLEAQSRGQTDYATPVFTGGEATDAQMYSYFANEFRGIREQISQPPTLGDDDDVQQAPSGQAAPAPSQGNPAAPAQPPEAEPIVTPEDDDDMPF